MNKIYFPIIPSTLILPGPHNKIVSVAARYTIPLSPASNICPCEAIKTTTHIPIIIGIQANRVNNPRINNIPHTSSAKMMSEREAVDPRCIKFINLYLSVLNFINLAYPWLASNKPVAILKINIPKLKAPAEYFVEKNLLIYFTIVLTKICAI